MQYSITNLFDRDYECHILQHLPTDEDERVTSFSNSVTFVGGLVLDTTVDVYKVWSDVLPFVPAEMSVKNENQRHF